jgi:hypothetical protein
MNAVARFGALVALASLFVSARSAGQEDLSYAEELTRKIQAAQAIGTLGSNLFGDETNWYTGQTTFRVVDVDIPGNNALPVRVARTRSTAPPDGGAQPGLMGDWELELPYVSSLVERSAGWRGGATRCSSPVGQPDVGAFAEGEYWRGYSISIPGQASGLMLKRDSAAPAPADGLTYPWVAGGHTQIRCAVALKNGTGVSFP